MWWLRFNHQGFIQQIISHSLPFKALPDSSLTLPNQLQSIRPPVLASYWAVCLPKKTPPFYFIGLPFPFDTSETCIAMPRKKHNHDAACCNFPPNQPLRSHPMPRMYARMQSLLCSSFPAQYRIFFPSCVIPLRNKEKVVGATGAHQSRRRVEAKTGRSFLECVRFDRCITGIKKVKLGYAVSPLDR